MKHAPASPRPAPVLSPQSADHVLMIRPARFLSNPQTAASNAFQHAELDPWSSQAAAVEEFDGYVAALRAAGVGVTVVEDTPEPHTPDSIFPNNWVSFDQRGRVFLYPMQAPNRRQERRMAVLAELERHFLIEELVDFGRYAAQSQFLEGTGSMVLDHVQRIAYACHSPRSHPVVMDAFTAATGYRARWFHALDRHGKPIYHTNVMMCVGSRLAIVCFEAMPHEAARTMLLRSLQASGKEVIAISLVQMESFAGNMLELRATDGSPVVAVSRSAWASLTPAQRERIAVCARPVIAAIDTIERLGGGSARCMLAEVFLPKRAAASQPQAETVLAAA